MKFTVKKFTIEVEKEGQYYRIISDEPLARNIGLVMLEFIKYNFLPADCEALDLVDPDRVKRISEEPNHLPYKENKDEENLCSR